MVALDRAEVPPLDVPEVPEPVAADQQPLSKKAAEKLGIFPSLALGGLAVRDRGALWAAAGLLLLLSTWCVLGHVQGSAAL